MTRGLALLLLVLALAGCAKEPAGYQLAGGDLSITVERTKPYFWSSGWELSVITRRSGECQRRHAMKPTASGKVRVEIYTPERGVFILRQGKRWYVTELRNCGFDTFQEPPPEPGELVGAFREKGGVFRFVEEGANAAKGNGQGQAE